MKTNPKANLNECDIYGRYFIKHKVGYTLYLTMTTIQFGKFFVILYVYINKDNPSTGFNKEIFCYQRSQITSFVAQIYCKTSTRVYSLLYSLFGKGNI